MPWPLRLVESWEAVRDQYGYVPVGACWFDAWRLEKTRDYAELSPDYLQNHAAARPPLSVQLPGGVSFCVDTLATSGAGGWIVTGVPPLITVSPSINAIAIYHGYITEGVILDDCEGRTFTGQLGQGFP